ncbi:MAG: ABC transporter ATP-binding protein [Cryobacterium sp.]
MSALPLVVQNLHVGFDRAGADTVQGVSFVVAAGECLAIVGESGSGKSVTARSLLGLAGAGSRVSADTLSLAGESVLGFSDAEWRAHRGKAVGLVLQDALVSLDPLRPIGREIGDSLRLHTTLSAAARARRVVELLDAVGLPDPHLRVHQRSGELSGGERQRALIAAAIALDPPLLIADEPTTALDVTVQAQILDLFEAITRSGTALVLISHDLAVVARVADRVAVMSAGSIVETGTVAEVLHRPQHPDTRRMVAAVPADKPRGTRLSAPGPPETVPPPSGARAPAPGPTTGDRTADAAAAPIVLSATGLRKSFRRPDGSRHLAVNDVSLDLRRGSTLGIVGESGSGKTTTARLLLALTVPEQGEVRVLGQPWSSRTERARRPLRASVGAVFQDALGSFDPRLNVAEILRAAVAGPAGNHRHAHAQRVGELLDDVGLPRSITLQRPRDLSGGQRQRVGIARALASRPQILICDEPVSSLDVSVQAQVLDLLDDLQRRHDLSLVFISHDLGVVQHISDRVAVMQHGRIVEIGAATQIFRDPGQEYTRRLLASVPRLV